MIKILGLNRAIAISKKLKKEKKKIVLAGGCFDILHVGHIKFLQESKKYGDLLFILLENDEGVKKLKGKDRPINSQTDRAEILASIKDVDCIVLLDKMRTNEDYDKIVTQLNPDVIAITKDSGQEIHAKRQAEKINAKVISVIKRVSDKSTTKLARLILEKLD